MHSGRYFLRNKMQYESLNSTHTRVSSSISWFFVPFFFFFLLPNSYCQGVAFSDIPDMQRFFLHSQKALNWFKAVFFYTLYVFILDLGRNINTANSPSTGWEDQNSYLHRSSPAFLRCFLISKPNPTPNRITSGQGCKDLLNTLILWQTIVDGLAGRSNPGKNWIHLFRMRGIWGLKPKGELANVFFKLKNMEMRLFVHRVWHSLQLL